MSLNYGLDHSQNRTEVLASQQKDSFQMADPEIHPIEIVFVTENGQQTAEISDAVNQRLMLLSEASSMHHDYVNHEEKTDMPDNNLVILSEASTQEFVDAGSTVQTVYITHTDGTIVASNEIIINGEEVISAAPSTDGIYEEANTDERDEGYRHLGELVGNLEASLKADTSCTPSYRRRKTPAVEGTHPYTCQVCSKTFQSVSNLNRHYRIHTGERPYLCKFCGKNYAQIDHLKRHIAVIHTHDTQFKCDICHKRYQEKHRYVVHLRSHSGERPFVCAICEKSFAYKEGLTKHLRVHTGEKSYECDYCMKRFSESQALRIHRRIHTGERPYPCKFCFKSFITKKALRVHVRVHTGERPFTCTQCPKTFISKSSLNNHQKAHNSLPLPFVCKVCEKRFQHQSTLRNHSYSHTKEKPFHCGVCYKRYRRRATLAIHMKSHDDMPEGVADDSLLYCGLCNKQFTAARVYEFHMKIHAAGGGHIRLTKVHAMPDGRNDGRQGGEGGEEDEWRLLEAVREAGVVLEDTSINTPDRSHTYLMKSQLEEFAGPRRQRRRSV